MNAVNGRQRYAPAMIVTLDHGTLDLDRRVFVTPAGEVRLTTTEARLLAHLAAQPHRTFGREQLQVEVWGYRAGIPSRTVFTTVGRVRQKIELDPANPRYLLSSDGGYRFATPQGGPVTPSLPQPATAFVGRDFELDELTRAIDGGARLLSILGPGGIGKTRLAIELARRISARFPDGVAFVGLESVESAAALASALFAALALRPAGPGEDHVAALVERLRERDQLVVCDNVEQIVGAPALLAALVTRCPAVRIVATSRVRLSVSCETAFALSPMAAPSSGAALEGADAGRFVLAHARRMRPAWDPTAGEREQLATLCGLTEGSPLAMELATAWLRLIEPDEIVRELERGADLLRTDNPDVPIRHTSVRSAMDASFRLLAPESVRALGALAVIRSPFSRDSAEAIAGAGLRELGQLVDASMIRRAGSGRFAFHPAVRDEALARLDAHERAMRERQHAAHFLDGLTGSYAALDAADGRERDWLERHAPDHLDLVAAFDHAARMGDAARIAAGAEPYYRYLDGHNRFAELSAAWARAKAELRSLPPSPDRDVAHGLLLALEQGAGWAVRDSDESLPLLEARGGEPLVLGLIGASIAAQIRGDTAHAVELGRRAVALARPRGRMWATGYALSVCASANARAGDLEAAAALLEEAVAVAAMRGGRGHCRPLVHLGEVYLRMNHLERARETLTRALTECRDTDDRAFALLAQSRLGEAQARLGEDPTAAWIEAIEEACAHHIPAYWWHSAVFGLANARMGDPGTATVAIAALASFEQTLPVGGEEQAALERAFERGAEVLGADAARGWRRGGAATELEQAALALIAV